MIELLFSYGTLQLEKVQLESFGRKLIGHKDVLKGYKLGQLQITDKDVLAKSGQEFHPMAIPSTPSKNDKIAGVLFEITPEELAQADKYEVDDYKRVKCKFESGKEGWIYIQA